MQYLSNYSLEAQGSYNKKIYSNLNITAHALKLPLIAAFVCIYFAWWCVFIAVILAALILTFSYLRNQMPTTIKYSLTQGKRLIITQIGVDFKRKTLMDLPICDILRMEIGEKDGFKRYYGENLGDDVDIISVETANEKFSFPVDDYFYSVLKLLEGKNAA